MSNKVTNNKSIELLNKALADELSAALQYMFFHFHCHNQGYDLLASLFRKTAISEMIHCERLAERILFLKGEVTMKPAQQVVQIFSLKEMLDLAKKMEQESMVEYNHWANKCSANSDAISKTLFESLVADEENHFQQFEHEIESIEKFGLNYLALQSIERSKTKATD